MKIYFHASTTRFVNRRVAVRDEDGEEGEKIVVIEAVRLGVSQVRPAIPSGQSSQLPDQALEPLALGI